MSGLFGNIRLPTRTDDWRLMIRTARLVLSVPVYALLSVLIAVLAITVFVVSQNIPLVRDVVIGGTLPFEARLQVLLGLFPFLGTSFSIEAGLLLITVGLLVGLDIAMVTYHLREHGVGARESGGSVIGVVLGTLGAGCAACGSAILAGVLSLVGGAGLLTVLPLDGLEFSLLAMVALVLSIYWLADGMRGGEINGCPVDLN
ncbi:MAG: hypothetical protein ABEH65_09445 [Halobacteriales archaeon]